MKDLVSIITPTYNGEKFIGDTIQSVLNQTYQNWEMLIVDDCSDDNTETVVKSFEDSRIKYFRNPKNSGAAISRNIALSKAEGKWIAFLDGDDMWCPDKLEKQISFMEENGYDFTYTNYSVVDEEGNSLDKYVTGPKKVGRVLINCYNWLGCLTVVYNAEKIGLIQIPDIRKRNDWVLWLTALKGEKCYLLDQKLSIYRKRSGSISRSKKLQMISYHFEVYRDVMGYSIPLSAVLIFVNLACGVFKKAYYHKNEG